MQRANILITVFWIGLFTALVYMIYDNFSKYPNEKSKSTTTIIPIYPNNSLWQISNEKELCFYYITKCTDPASVITFNTTDYWSSIYNFYITKLKETGWQTNSSVLTSIPTSIVFIRSDLFVNTSCETTIISKGNNNSKDPNTIKTYTISTVCN